MQKGLRSKVFYIEIYISIYQYNNQSMGNLFAYLHNTSAYYIVYIFIHLSFYLSIIYFYQTNINSISIEEETLFFVSLNKSNISTRNLGLFYFVTLVPF